MLPLVLLAAAAAELPQDLKRARDAQDKATLDNLASAAAAQAQAKPADGTVQFRAALSASLRAEVLMEQRDRNGSRAAAEAGLGPAVKAVELEPNNAEYRRVHGALCAQSIPGNILNAMKYGRCALDEVNKAVELAPKSAEAWLARGVGNTYLPPSFGGGPDVALKDIDKALELDQKLADAWLWRGIVLARLNRPAEARKAFQKCLELNPQRVWARQQLDKTPEK
jgi:tetratricopeptide (TPR) repeat protein